MARGRHASAASARSGRASALGRIKHKAQPSRTLAQRGLGAALLRYITGDFGGTNHTAHGVPDRRDRDRNRQPRAVPGLAHGVKGRQRLALRQVGQDLHLFGFQLGRDQHLHRLADGLLSAVAKQGLGGPVPVGDAAVQGLADDGVVGRLDDGGQPGPLGLDLVDRRHVAEHHHQALHRAVV